MWEIYTGKRARSGKSATHLIHQHLQCSHELQLPGSSRLPGEKTAVMSNQNAEVGSASLSFHRIFELHSYIHDAIIRPLKNEGCPLPLADDFLCKEARRSPSLSEISEDQASPRQLGCRRMFSHPPMTQHKSRAQRNA